MASKRTYNTKHASRILEYLASLGDEHTTASDVYSHFASAGQPIALTTVYRQLEKLNEQGSVHKFSIDDKSPACYQYANHGEELVEHFHLKCEQCGELIHLECNLLERIQTHVLSEHSFRINTSKTVLYGTCTNCM